MFASTNLVFELGIVLWIFLRPAFTVAEFVGGFLLILLLWGAVRALVSGAEEKEVRTHAQEADTGHVHTIASRARSWRERADTVRGAQRGLLPAVAESLKPPDGGDGSGEVLGVPQDHIRQFALGGLTRRLETIGYRSRPS